MMNNQPKIDKELNNIAFLQIVIAVVLFFAGLSLVGIALKHLGAIGDSLLIDSHSVKQMLRSLLKIGGIALPLIAVALGTCSILVLRNVKKRKD